MTKTIRGLLKVLAFTVLAGVGTSAMAQEAIRLRIASGHPPANTYVALMQGFFVPEITKRVAEKTKYKVEFVEGYGGAMVKVADTLKACSPASSISAGITSASNHQTCRCTRFR